MARIVIPTVPKNIGNAALSKWLYDTTSYLESLASQVSSMQAIPRVYYVDTPKLRENLGQLVLVPDHPMGPSIIVWDGTQFSRFTAAGVL